MTLDSAHFCPSDALKELWRQLEPQLEDLAAEELRQQLDAQFQELTGALATHNETAYTSGQQLLCLLIGNYPQFTPLIPRQLLWLLGGDCLHFMTDEELSAFQQAEDAAIERGEQNTLH